jgi:hypothetical protein
MSLAAAMTARLPALTAVLAQTVTSGMRSPYQQLKNFILQLTGISKDAVHLYIGIGCLLVSLLVLRFAPSSYKALILGALVSLTMEALDLHDNVRYRETTRVMAGLHDLWNTNLLPFFIVLSLRLRLGPPGKTATKGRG